MKNWELTKIQYLAAKYKYMSQRVTEKARSNEGRNYFGLPIVARKAFMDWASSDPTFSRLWKNYKRSQGNRAKAPSIDRININRGYTLGNMQFLTLSNNVKKATVDRRVVLVNETTGRVFRFRTRTEASKFLGHSHPIKLSHKFFVNTKKEKFFNNSF